MLKLRDIKAHNVLLLDTETGTRAAMIKNNRVIHWNPMVSRKSIAEAAGRPLDWSGQTGRYSIYVGSAE